MDFPPPKPGDIVQCRFPEGKIPRPGPKERPGLVLDVETLPSGSCDVVVAYGTSQDVSNRYPGEFTVPASEYGAGLSRDTKFNLRQSAKLPFNDEWFGIAPGQPFGPNPKRGSLDLSRPLLKRGLHSAITEAKAEGFFDFLDMGSRRER